MHNLKNFKNFSINENIDIDNYLKQLDNDTRYFLITKKLYNEIEEEGWVEQLEDFYNKTLNKFNFKYMMLNLNNNDQKGLIEFNEDTIEKFNDFDIQLKSMDKYPFQKLDFIDYEKGIVYIIKHNI
jgi:hypothetical protein